MTFTINSVPINAGAADLFYPDQVRLIASCFMSRWMISAAIETSRAGFLRERFLLSLNGYIF
jgi:hypothetical protein